jgi:hypothetical protein
MKKIIIMASLLITSMVLQAFAGKGKPNFTEQLWADGQTWGTKGTTSIPGPNEHNEHSFDLLFVITNSNNPNGQLPVAEASPGNVNYNGGRWITNTAWWTDAGIAAHGTVPVLTSYADFLTHFMLGHLDYVEGPPDGGPPPYFQCPLLPVKN